MAMQLRTDLAAGEPVSVVPIDSQMVPRQPQVAVDLRGMIHLVFSSQNEIYYTTSVDQGKSFHKPSLVAKPSMLALGMRRGPRIAISEKAIAISAIGGELGGGRDGDLWSWRSEDQGKTWQGPVQVNDAKISARECLHAMAASPDGELFCTWLDLRNKRTELWGLSSNDKGATWSKNVLVYQSPDGSICECCHPSATYDKQGRLAVLWRNSFAGNRDMYMALTLDHGKTFAAPSKLGQGAWELDSCPMDGGALTATADGKYAAVWRRKNSLFATQNDQSTEQFLEDGLQPWLAAYPNRHLHLWIQKRLGDLWLLTP
ncbi:MAG: sialidase family protein [Pirellulales bacterium]|nr:sialidase family protein [Pirellulales bacterium]